jgi:cytochrome c oxidase subunit 2
VYAVEEAEFEAWVAEQQQPAEIPTEGAAAAGWETYQVVCTACHNATGATAPVSREITANVGNEQFVFEASLAPDLTHFGSRTTFGGASFEWDEDHLRSWLANPADLKPMRPDQNDIANGRILGMPNFELTDAEIDNLIALLEAWQ